MREYEEGKRNRDEIGLCQLGALIHTQTQNFPAVAFSKWTWTKFQPVESVFLYEIYAHFS